MTQSAGMSAFARSVNLPNAISAARIIVSPLIAFLPLIDSPLWRIVHAGRAAVNHAANGRAVGFTKIGDREELSEGVAAHNG